LPRSLHGVAHDKQSAILEAPDGRRLDRVVFDRVKRAVQAADLGHESSAARNLERIDRSTPVVVAKASPLLLDLLSQDVRRSGANRGDSPGSHRLGVVVSAFVGSSPGSFGRVPGDEFEIVGCVVHFGCLLPGSYRLPKKWEAASQSFQENVT
jgi:hypothetical protein